MKAKPTDSPKLATSRHGPSFLRWAGSKRKALARLKAQYSPSKRYVEPFAGSAALFFALKPEKALLADLNGHLINTLRVVKQNPLGLHSALEALNRDKETYYKIRDEFNGLNPTGLKSAVRFLYLNRNGFNGLWRTNLQGHYNVPWGGSEMGGNPPIELLEECSATLGNAEIIQQDFRKTILSCGEGDFIYADPPYFTSTQRTFVEYGKQSFGLDDLSDLLAALKDAEARGASIALTYSAAMPIPNIPEAWQRIEFDVTRNVAGFSGRRRKQTEILYTNQEAEAA